LSGGVNFEAPAGRNSRDSRNSREGIPGTVYPFVCFRFKFGVEAAHIDPVAADRPDRIQNGLALSGKVHWMFGALVAARSTPNLQAVSTIGLRASSACRTISCILISRR
jgi:hypothetical protein